MDRQQERKRRLEQFLELARDYRGWSRAQLAQSLHRDPTKLVPESGNPKLDFVFRLAEVVDWSVGDVAEAIGLDFLEEESPNGAAYAELDFPALVEKAGEAHAAGDYHDLVELARAAATKARTPNERAIACIRETGGWDGLGRYARALECLRDGVQLQGVDERFRIKIQVNLANAHYTLWQLVEGRALAGEVISDFEFETPTHIVDRASDAFARYVRGHCFRRLAAEGETTRIKFAERAVDDLETARDLYVGLAEELGNETLLGIANTCAGGIIEADVLRGRRGVEEAVEELAAGLDLVVDLDESPVGDQLESYGWWSIFGCNIALRSLEGAVQQQHMAVFTNKAYEIADRLDNWAMRERAFTMEHFRRRRLTALAGGVESDWVIDTSDIKVLTGTMGRFPGFRRTGWQILRHARVVRDG